ncbi:MAG: hypothetical protein Kow00108_15790 [Calditrichia bacterium]
MPYHFKKWYIELQSDEGHLFFSIFSDIRFGVFRFLQVKGYYFFQNQFQRAFETNLPVSSIKEDSTGNYRGIWGEIQVNSKGFTLHIQHKNLILNFQTSVTELLQNSNCKHEINRINGAGSILWVPLSLSEHGQLSLNYGDLVLKLEGNCYVDRVSSNIYPWKVPIKKLFWGHNGDRSNRMVYTITQLTGNVTGTLFFMNKEKKIKKIDAIQRFSEEKITGKSEGIHSVFVELSGKSASPSLRIEPDQMVHRSGYFEDENGNWSLARRFLHTISLKPTGIKYFSNIKLVESGKPFRGITFPQCFSEMVIFDKE